MTNKLDGDQQTSPETPEIRVLTGFIAKPMIGCGWFTDMPLKRQNARFAKVQFYTHFISEGKWGPKITSWGVYK